MEPRVQPARPVPPDRAVQTESRELRGTGATGATGLNWQSAPWSSGATYNLDDAVFYNGSSYVSRRVPTPATSRTPRPPSGRCWRNKAPLAQPEPRVRMEKPRVQPARPVPPDRAVQTESTEPRARRVQRAPPVRLASTGSLLLGPPVPPIT